MLGLFGSRELQLKLTLTRCVMSNQRLAHLSYSCTPTSINKVEFLVLASFSTVSSGSTEVN